jgi:hypothetical protein
MDGKTHGGQLKFYFILMDGKMLGNCHASFFQRRKNA